MGFSPTRGASDKPATSGIAQPVGVACRNTACDRAFNARRLSFDVDAIILALGIWWLASMALYMGDVLFFYAWAHSRGIRIPPRALHTAGEVLRAYLRRCREDGIEPDQRRVKTHRGLRRNLLASLVGFVVMIVLVVIQNRERYPVTPIE